MTRFVGIGSAWCGAPAQQGKGQILVLTAISMVALVSAVGLVLDGGGTFVQRRDQQNASDLAALAGANAWLVDTNTLTRDQSAINAARAVATSNGYTDGANAQIVNVTLAPYGQGESVQVDIGAPHHNAFGGLIGLPSWPVSTTATAAGGPGGGAQGSAPVMFHVNVFPGGQPTGQYADPAHPFVFGETNGDYPVSPNDVAWTDFHQPDNVDTQVVRNIIHGTDTQQREFDFGDYIGQENQGNHSDLYEEVDTYLANQNVVVPIVDGAGNFQGWAIFHVVSASRPDKQITGYFVSGFSDSLDICMDAGDCLNNYGGFALKLVN